jgi:hypothetical protein
MRSIFVHQKPPKDLKGAATARGTYIPSGELAWPRMRSTRTLAENRAAGERILRILANGDRPPS